MKLSSKEIDFPAKIQLSFSPLIEKMKMRMDDFGGEEAKYLSSLIKKADPLLNLKNGVSEAELKKYRPVVDELMRVIFPSGLTDNEIKLVTAPWSFDPIYSSRRFEKISSNAGNSFQLDFEGFNEDEMYIAACSFILGMHFKLPIKLSRPFYFDIPNKETGQMHYYRLANNVDFLEVIPTNKALPITKEDYHQLIDNYSDIELWKKKFPVDSWVYSGFMILNMMDLTKDRLLGKLTNDLLNASADGLKNLQGYISELIQVPVQLSFVSIKGNTLLQGGTKEMKPLMLGASEGIETESLMCSWTHGELIEKEKALAIPDVDNFASRSDSDMAQNLKKAGIKSYFASPVIYNDTKLGFLELGSKLKGALNSTIERQLEQVLPVLAVAGHRFHQEQANKIEAIIQAECTTIHPSVKWRFEEEAHRHLRAIEHGEEHKFNDLVFKDVYPLFGQLDIRNSSVTRNEGIKNDLQTQLIGARKILVFANEMKPMPLYDQMIFMIDSHYQQLETEMVSASEQDILFFLNKEIRSVLKHLSKQNKKFKKAFKEYESSLHPELHFVYKERKSFDDAVNTVNKVLSSYIDKKQVEAQKMFPHHFERYSTDGLEFNIYVGESISPKQGFHELMVKNLRLWQLMVIVELEREYDQVKKTLEKPLSVAALVLAYSSTLSIQFRMDEKQFDVEGAYNARYEIIKKRIDKAHIKGTDERVTEPGKMVVVYSREEDEREYLRYFKFLQSKGYLGINKPEILVLEDLQGVSGLKALRADIDYKTTGAASDMSMEDIIAEIESEADGKKKPAKSKK